MAPESERTEPPLIVIVGPTASGKTSIAIELAERFDGEIICADSRTVYKGMDIGTAKPSQDEREKVVHWGLDLVEPDQAFTAADFKAYAVDRIRDVRARGRAPIVVGGTGLYIDSILFDFQFGSPPDLELRGKLESMTLEELHDYCIECNIKIPENNRNKRYVVRAIERNGSLHKSKMQVEENIFVVGIATEKDILRTRIAQRAEQLFENGVVEEATRLGEMCGWNSEAMTGNVYPLIRQHLESDLALDKVVELFATLDRQLAKRQLTWLRRNPHIVWLQRTEVVGYLSSLLANKP